MSAPDPIYKPAYIVSCVDCGRERFCRHKSLPRGWQYRRINIWDVVPVCSKCAGVG